MHADRKSKHVLDFALCDLDRASCVSVFSLKMQPGGFVVVALVKEKGTHLATTAESERVIKIFASECKVALHQMSHRSLKGGKLD